MSRQEKIPCRCPLPVVPGPCHCQGWCLPDSGGVGRAGDLALFAGSPLSENRGEMNGSDDLELWERSVQGDAGAFGALFQRHSAKVYNYAFRRTGDWSVAEEAVAIVFLEAWRRRGDVTFARDSALPWLLGVATNVLRNQWRSKRRHRNALQRLQSAMPSATPDEDIAARVDDQRRVERVLASVRQLSRRHRDVLALCVWEELTYEQVATALGVPVGTVRSRLARARQRLRDLDTEPQGLDGHHQGDRQATEEAP